MRRLLGFPLRDQQDYVALGLWLDLLAIAATIVYGVLALPWVQWLKK